METLTIRQARRLALARAGLLKPEWTGMPTRARGRAPSARRACHEVIRRFGYLQLDSIGISGARTHGLVLMSRLDGLDPSLAEELLQPDEPIFEYLGHEACWQPMEDYPIFAFRRRELREVPRWGVFAAEHGDLAKEILRRIEDEGPLRSLDFDSRRFGSSWQLKTATLVASANGLSLHAGLSGDTLYVAADDADVKKTAKDHVPIAQCFSIETPLMKEILGFLGIHHLKIVETFQQLWIMIQT